MIYRVKLFENSVWKQSKTVKLKENLQNPKNIHENIWRAEIKNHNRLKSTLLTPVVARGTGYQFYSA